MGDSLFFFLFFSSPLYFLPVNFFFSFYKIKKRLDEGDVILIDTTECPISRSKKKDVQQATWSGYKHRHTLKYELGLSEKKGVPVWVSGPYVGPEHDLTIFSQKLEKLMKKKGWVGYADGTYYSKKYSSLLNAPQRRKRKKKGEKKRREIYRSPEEKERAKMISRKRIKVENFFGRMKYFRVLSERFRYPLKLHAVFFYLIAQLVTEDMAFRPLRRY